MITTLDQVKTILGITDTDQYIRIEALIPLVEKDYLSIRNKPFDRVYKEYLALKENETLVFLLLKKLLQTLTKFRYILMEF